METPSAFLSIVQVAATALAAWTVANLLLGRVWDFPHWTLKASALTALGLLLWSHVIFGLTCAGLAQPWIFQVLLVVLFLTAFGGCLQLLVGEGFARLTRAVRGFFGGVGAVARIALVLAYSGWMIAVALLPASAVDELVYHLEVPRRMLQEGGQTLFQDNIYSYYPQFGEMFFLFGLAVAGVTAAKLFHGLFTLLLAFAVYGCARQFSGRRHAQLAAVALLSTPSVMVIAGWAYVDLMFTLFAFLAVTALVGFLETRQSSWALLAGAMAGGACCVKYTGIQLVLLLLLIAFCVQLAEKRRSWPAAFFSLVALAVLIASPYYLRNLILTGWPLFPFQLPFFPLEPELNWDSSRAQLFLRWLASFGVASQGLVLGKILAPILVFVKARFGDAQAFDGVLGPVFLLAPLLWLRLGERVRPMRLFMWFTLCFAAYWTITTQQVRFLLPVIPVLAVILAYGMAGKPHRLLHPVVWVLVALNVGVAVHKVAALHPWEYWTGRESESAFLTRNVNGYPMYEEVNRVVKADEKVYLVGSSNYLYYLTCPWRADYVFEDYRFVQAVETANSPDDISTFLTSQQITHLMLNEFLLTHPTAGLPAAQLHKVRYFLATWAEEIFVHRGFRLFRLRTSPVRLQAGLSLHGFSAFPAPRPMASTE